MLPNKEFSLFKSKAPAYTIRMLLSQVTSESKDIPQLKPFSHFTLGCTYEDETIKVTQSLEKLRDYFKEAVSFEIDDVINLGNEGIEQMMA